MSTLTEIVVGELEAILELGEQAFSSLESDLKHLEPKEKKEAIKKSRTIRSRIDQVRKLYKFSMPTDPAEFNLQNIASAHRVHNRIMTALPSHEESLELTELIERSLSRTEAGKEFKYLRIGSIMNFILSSVIGFPLTMAAAATISPVYVIPASCFAYSAGLTILEWMDKGSPDNMAKIHYSATTAGFLAFYTLMATGVPENGEMRPVAVSESFGFGILSGLMGIFTVSAWRSAPYRKKLREKKKAFEKTSSSIDAFTKYGIAISEARRSLMRVDRWIRKGVDPSAFDEQISRLEDTLRDYIVGEASYDDLIGTRISYSPPAVRTTGRSQIYAPSPKPAQIQGPGKKRRHIRQNEVAAASEQELEEKVEIVLHPALQRVYDAGRATFEGYNVQTVVEACRNRLEARPNSGVFLSEKFKGKHLNRAIRRRYGLPDDTKLFKFKAFKDARVIFYKSNDQIVLLEPMSHEDYVGRMRRR